MRSLASTVYLQWVFMRRTCCWLLAVLLAVPAGGQAAAVEPALGAAPWHAQYTDGTRLTGHKLAGWAAGEAAARLDDTPLFDPARPLRWLMSSTGPDAEPGAFVELVGGDRLPGRVAAYVAVDESPVCLAPPHLLVEPLEPVEWPGQPAKRSVRVLVHAVRRVVWAGRSTIRYEPGTLYYRNGRRLAFRSLRWGRDRVYLLVERGTVEVPFSQAAELHLPRGDTWREYFWRLAVLCPEAAGRLVRMETSQGLRVTASTSRHTVRLLQPGEHDRWIHVVQPWWSLDALCVRSERIRSYTFFEPAEVPLSWLEPLPGPEPARLAGGRAWRLDRNVQGGPLRSGGDAFAWGLGVHAQQELMYPLGPWVRRFRTRIGLDELAGRGGCARGRVALEGQPGMLAESPALVGSAHLFDTGWLDLSLHATQGARLVLVADALHEGRPPGADPLNIRDMLDWLEPLFELDRSLLGEQIRQALRELLEFWPGWSVSGDPPHAANLWYVNDLGEPSFQLCLAPPSGGLMLGQTVEVGSNQDVLVLAADRPRAESAPSEIEVRIEGQVVARWSVPAWDVGQAMADPLVVSLAEYLGRRVRIEILQTATDRPAWTCWRALSVVGQPPRLLRLAEEQQDQPDAVSLLAAGDGQLAWTDEDSFTGPTSLRLSNGWRGAAVIAGWELPIRYRPRLGEFRYLRFAWRTRGGGAALQLGHDGRFGPDLTDMRHSFAYEVGSAMPLVGAATRLATEPSDEWLLVTRDLYADFGSFTLTGLALAAPPGGEVWLDHVYLARSPDDFDAIDALLAADAAQRRRQRLAPLLPGQTQQPDTYRAWAAAFAPEFTLASVGPDGLALLTEHAGRPNVLRVSCTAPPPPCLWQGTCTLRWKRRARLRLAAGHDGEHAWRLIVRANGQALLDCIVGPQTAPSGWLDQAVELTGLDGEKFGVALELRQEPLDGTVAPAYWQALDLEYH